MKKRELRRIVKQALPPFAVKAISSLRRGSKGSAGSSERYSLKHSYAIVSAVYNVSEYLDDYFESLEKQTVGLGSIKIVMVDDGSTDSSADVIRRWQTKYPESVVYVCKENGGQASARNLGLSYVEGCDWVTFIDPDDFVSEDYFERVDRAVVKRPDAKFVSCNLIYYNESEADFSDTHPLNDRFSRAVSVWAVDDEDRPLQLSASTAFFSVDEIIRQDLRADEAIRPKFEDALFANQYLLNLSSGLLVFLKRPRYYYRKRIAANSTLDASWKTPDVLCNYTRSGCLALLRYAKQVRGHVPRCIQMTILYDISWTLKYLIGHPERCDFGSQVAEEFWDIFEQILAHIDDAVISSVPGKWINFENKVALLNLKGEESRSIIAYLVNLDRAQKTLVIKCACADFRLSVNGRRVEPVEVKRQDRIMLGRTVYSNYLMKFPYFADDQMLTFATDDCRPVTLAVRGVRKKYRFPMKRLIAAYTEGWEEYEQRGHWIIMDRDTQADDNAEHFYRYMKKNHPDQKCFFVLRRDAADWNRLESEGFNLLAFGSSEHEEKLRQCDAVISSHADAYVHSYFGDNFHGSKNTRFYSMV